MSYIGQCLYNCWMQPTHHATNAWCNAALQMSRKKLPSWAAAAQKLSTKLELQQLQSWEADINNMLKLLQDTQHGFSCLPSQTTDEPMLQAAKTQFDVQLDRTFSSQLRNACSRLAALVIFAKSTMTGVENMQTSKANSMEIRRELEVVHTVLMHAFWEVRTFPFKFLFMSMCYVATSCMHRFHD
jgi:hypothetical protein